jgi:hypothetical protein
MLFLHWDGAAWKETARPSPERIVRLDGVVVTGSASVWAAGFAWDSQGPIVVAHWDGSSWSLVQTPDITNFRGTRGPLAITALSDDDVWVVGSIFSQDTSILEERLLILHWNGSAWNKLPVDSPAKNLIANGISTAARGSVWIVGSRYDPDLGLQIPLLLHLGNSPCASPTLIPTATVPIPLPPPVPLPGSGSLFFPETGKKASGIFLDYWNSHGRLAQQGYPISDLIGEISDLDGKIYTMQYFERAVFEYHPENKPPNNVLLSQLGTFRYKQMYPYGVPNERPNTDSGTIYFPETGKHLGGAFHYYWLNHGGLPQQGYPISEEFTEVSPTDSRPYTVQYFERAVFEYHPENRGTPYEVLLSLLGGFRYISKYVIPAPTP